MYVPWYLQMVSSDVGVKAFNIEINVTISWFIYIFEDVLGILIFTFDFEP